MTAEDLEALTGRQVAHLAQGLEGRGAKVALGAGSLHEGGDLRLECSLDGLLHEQRCALVKDGEVVAERVGDVAYLDPAEHLASGFYLELGAAPPNEIETSPVGWVFSDLRIVGTKL